MCEYDNEILKANIRKLRDDSGLNQDDFAAIAGISQSRLSKLLGNDKGNRFSVDQVYKIASHFNVSVDYLITGAEPKPTSSTKQICEVIVHLFDDHWLDHVDHSREEDAYYPVYMNGLPDTDHERLTIKYNALFFPEYWYPDPNREYTEDEMDDLRCETYQVGNDLQSNMAINKFLKAYIPVHELHSAGKMPDDAYNYTVQSLLNSIK